MVSDFHGNVCRESSSVSSGTPPRRGNEDANANGIVQILKSSVGKYTESDLYPMIPRNFSDYVLCTSPYDTIAVMYVPVSGSVLFGLKCWVTNARRGSLVDQSHVGFLDNGVRDGIGSVGRTYR